MTALARLTSNWLEGESPGTPPAFGTPLDGGGQGGSAVSPPPAFGTPLDGGGQGGSVAEGRGGGTNLLLELPVLIAAGVGMFALVTGLLELHHYLVTNAWWWPW